MRFSLLYAAWLADEKVISQCHNELLTGAVISVSDDAFRVRNLPI